MDINSTVDLIMDVNSTIYFIVDIISTIDSIRDSKKRWKIPKGLSESVY